LADLEPVTDPEDIAILQSMIEDHLNYTGSAPAQRILDDWENALPRFKKIMPRDYRRILDERKARGESKELETAPNG
jgi:glutamate synthase domain-containing protein 3